MTRQEKPKKPGWLSYTNQSLTKITKIISKLENPVKLKSETDFIYGQDYNTRRFLV